MELVTLKDGYAEAPLPAVKTTMYALRSLMDEGALLVVYDALEHARTGERQFNADRLDAVGLTQGGVMHDLVKHIVLSAVSFDPTTFSASLSSPIAGPDA